MNVNIKLGRPYNTNKLNIDVTLRNITCHAPKHNIKNTPCTSDSPRQHVKTKYREITMIRQDSETTSHNYDYAVNNAKNPTWNCNCPKQDAKSSH